MKRIQTRPQPAVDEVARAPHPYPRNLSSLVKQLECWQQDPDEPDLWHGDAGVILNGAALEERAFYFEVVRVYTAVGGTPSTPSSPTAPR